MRKVLLLDVYNLIHRARTGFTSGDHAIVYNFFRGLRPIIALHDPDDVYFVLEGVPTCAKLDKDKIYNMFNEYGFKSMLKESTWKNFIGTFES